MGILTSLLTATAAPSPGAALEAASAETVITDATLADVNAPVWGAAGSVTRGQAVRVPAVSRARNVIAGTVGLLPVVAVDAVGDRIGSPRPWVRQPERDLPAAHTLTWTADDLFFHGVAYWRVAAVYREDGRPRRFERIVPTRVGSRERGGRRVLTVDGTPAPTTRGGRRVVIPGLDDGLLARAALTIRVALMLEQAAGNYAADPVPNSLLTSNGHAVMPPEKVSKALAQWREARRQGGTAYLHGFSLEAIGIDPSTMQLTEARQHCALEIARHANVDASYVNANEPGASLTYSNVTQERRKLTDFTLRHYMAAIEGRLAMDDVTRPGETLRFDLDDFLRGDAETRANVIQTLVGTTDSAGRSVLTVDEARAREGLTT